MARTSMCIICGQRGYHANYVVLRWPTTGKQLQTAWYACAYCDKCEGKPIPTPEVFDYRTATI